jgi:hypothetical protein
MIVALLLRDMRVRTVARLDREALELGAAGRP